MSEIFKNGMLKSDDILQNDELKKTPFTVPEGYFESLGGRVMQRVATSGKQQHGALRLTLRKWWPAAAAACLAAIVAASLLLWSPLQTDVVADADEEILDDIPEYLGLTAESIEDYAAAEDTDDISQEAIIEYLAYNGLSEAYLYEQLAEAE